MYMMNEATMMAPNWTKLLVLHVKHLNLSNYCKRLLFKFYGYTNTLHISMVYCEHRR